MLTIIRYIAAIVVAWIIGEFAAIPIALAIDAIDGAEVTGGDWPFTLANVILFCFKGAVIGCVAGTIAKKQGALVSALAVFLPLGVVTAIVMVRHFDLSRYVTVLSSTKLILWSWIPLVPAMLFGYMSAKEAQRSRWLVLHSVGTLTVYGGAFIALFAIHFYTIYLAYEISGFFAALLTLVGPVAAEIYWFVGTWAATGTFLNDYTMRLLTCGGLTIFLIVLGSVMIGTGGKYSAKRAASV